MLSPLPDFAAKITRASITVTPAWKLGRFAPFDRVLDPHGTHIVIHKRRLPVYLLVLALAGWVAATGLLYAHTKYRRGFGEVRYLHLVLLPWKLDEHRRAQGAFWIRRGLAAAESHDWRRAFPLLRGGLHSVPGHQEARMLVARIYLMTGRVDLARDTLITGLPYHVDQLEYLRAVIGFLFSQQADDAVVALASELGPRLDAGSLASRLAATARAYAMFNRGRFVGAEEALREAGLLDTPEGRFVLARIAWERGLRDEAIAHARELTARVPDELEIYRTLIFWLGEANRPGELRRAALARQLARPDAPEGHLDFIAACAAAGHANRAAEAEAKYLAHFADDVSALLRLGESAARRGDSAATRRVLARCRELGDGVPAAELLVLDAELERRNHAAILERTFGLLASDGGISGWSDSQQLALTGARAVALYGTGQAMEAEPLMRRLREARRLSPVKLTVIAGHLEAIGCSAEARALLRHAVELDPLYQPALVRLLESVVAAGELEGVPPLVERIAGMRRPPASLLQHLGDALQSDRQIFLPGRQRALAALAAADAGS